MVLVVLAAGFAVIAPVRLLVLVLANVVGLWGRLACFSLSLLPSGPLAPLFRPRSLPSSFFSSGLGFLLADAQDGVPVERLLAFVPIGIFESRNPSHVLPRRIHMRFIFAHRSE